MAAKSAGDALAQRSKEELIELIREMVQRHPDLAPMVDRPRPTAGQRKGPVDTEPVRRELRMAMQNYRGWGDRSVVATVYSLTNSAGQFATQGDWRSARAIYSAILEEGLRAGSNRFEDEGDYAGSLHSAVQGLIDGFDEPIIAQDAAERQATFDSLMLAYFWDRDMGGYGLADEIPDAILANATPAEAQAMRQQVAAAEQEHRARQYGELSSGHYTRFLVELDKLAGVDLEVIFQRLRDEGRYEILFEELLKLKRVDAAIEVAANHLTAGYPRVQAVLHLAQAGHLEPAIRLAYAALETQYDQRLVTWLLGQLTGRYDKPARLDLLYRQMLGSPSEQHYAELKGAAKQLKRWETLSTELIAKLAEQQNYPALILIYLHEEEWDTAWMIYEQQVQGGRDPWQYTQFDLQIAHRSREARPAKAIPIYLKYARAEIAGRSRGHYIQAAEYLAEVRKMYRRLGREEEWQKLIGEIRAEHRPLRALREELDRAGL